MGHGITSSDSMFSVREMPWHGLGTILDEEPSSIEEALLASGLEWPVEQSAVYVENPEQTLDTAPVIEVPGFRANVRKDTGKVLGIVSDDYTVVQNREAFAFLDDLIGSDLYFETAGSLHEGRRVWVLARVPEYVEVGGDQVANYLYVANSHDGSMSVTAAVTPIRIVCANTLGAALRRSERGAGAARTYKFRHTGDLAVKFDEARKVMGLTIDYAKQFKVLGDKLAVEKFSVPQFERVAKKLVGFDEPDLGDRAKKNRLEAVGAMTAIFRGDGPAGDTTGNAPGTAWTAFNAIGEYADHCRRVTSRTNQISRSFEDTDLKDRALALVTAEVE